MNNLWAEWFPISTLYQINVKKAKKKKKKEKKKKFQENNLEWSII